mgnify:CR=1 FL=1
MEFNHLLPFFGHLYAGTANRRTLEQKFNHAVVKIFFFIFCHRLMWLPKLIHIFTNS